MNLQKLRTLRRRIYLWYLALFLFRFPHYHFFMWQFILIDLENIIRYDRKKQKEMRVPLPNLLTAEGNDLLADLLEAYGEARPISDAKQQEKIMDAGGWKCTCGKANPAYTSTCVCGAHKRDIPLAKRQPAKPPTHWTCACGRENPNYTSTCVCGKNKRDVSANETAPR